MRWSKRKDTAIFQNDVRLANLTGRDGREPVGESGRGGVCHRKIVLGRRQGDLCDAQTDTSGSV